MLAEQLVFNLNKSTGGLIIIYLLSEIDSQTIVIRNGVFVTTTHVPSDIYSAIGDNAFSFIVFFHFLLSKHYLS